MTHGKHRTTRQPGNSGYSAKWSGVSYTPHCYNECTCADCDEPLHLEGVDTHYCPVCDNHKAGRRGCNGLAGLWREFGEVAVGKDECIMGDWRDFVAGTEIYEIWLWFEETYGTSISELMGLE